MSNDDSAWIFDSLICFLNGPIWNAPLQSFIEEKSMIFEPSVSSDEAEFRKIYEEFKNLVDLMLGTYMEDIEITPEQFEAACSKQYLNTIPFRFHENLFQQIWAANDYNIFKRMMYQKNIELQLQALDILERQYGINLSDITQSPTNDDIAHAIDELKQTHLSEKRLSSSNSSLQTSPGDAQQISDDEELQMNFKTASIQSPIREKWGSKDATDTMDIASSEKAVLNEVFNEHILDQADKQDNFVSIPESLHRDLEQQLIAERHLLERVIKTTQCAEPVARKLPDRKKVSFDDSANQSFDKSDGTFEVQTKTIDEKELRQRQKYLREQRDKLIALKKQVREKQLTFNDYQSTDSKNSRPKSSRTARALLTNDNISMIEPKTLQFRKALAERLKTEVVGQTAN